MVSTHHVSCSGTDPTAVTAASDSPGGELTTQVAGQELVGVELAGLAGEGQTAPVEDAHVIVFHFLTVPETVPPTDELPVYLETFVVNALVT